MIVYEASKEGFINDVRNRIIDEKIANTYEEKLGRRSPAAEIASWRNSLKDMREALDSDDIPNDAQVAIEYQVPNTSKRVDFLISGRNNADEEHVIIVELKQWEKANATSKDGVVETFVGGSVREVTHPSYQAWTYASLIRDFNQTVQEENINLVPCAFLHNYTPRKEDPLFSEHYAFHLEQAPVFLRRDVIKLESFIKRYVQKGDHNKILYRIENGKIKPSKGLAEKIGSMLKGNTEFNMIDEQKTVFEELKYLAIKTEEKSLEDRKDVVIIKGGPGTGKSVIAVNLLAQLIMQQINARYVTKNSAPREVYAAMLKGDFTKSSINNLFTGSGKYVDSENDEFATLIVDEAHRLNEKSGMFANLGENQMKEIIHAAKLSVFFIDEAQMVTWKDKGSVAEIRQWANHYDADVYEMELTSQFRCNGSDGFLAWVDDVLGIRETANKTLDTSDFDFMVVDSPNELRDIIFEKNKLSNKARLLAGYTWEWTKANRDDTKHHDIHIDHHHFGMSWNLGSDGQQWLIKPNSVNEIGCIHTSQGLELDYIGVIIGDDLRYENGEVITDPSKRAKTDQSIKGYKKALKENPEAAKKKADAIIRNTYRTLLTRGMKGCYVYCTDEALNEYIKHRIKNSF